MASYKNGMAMFDLKNNVLRKQQKNEWFTNHYKEVVSYDWLIDIDSPSHLDLDFAYEDAKKIKAFLDENNVTYELRFSGKGFHFIVHYEQFAFLNLSFVPDEVESIYKFYMRLGEKLKDKFSELIDYSITDSRRICKLPYSLAIYPADIYVCWPFLSDEEFNNFKLEDMKPKNISNIRGRGTYVFNAGNKDVKLLIENLTRNEGGK